MSFLTITNVAWSLTPATQQHTTLQYRLTSDPDVPGSYTTVGTNVLIDPDGHLPTPQVISGLLANTSYTAYAFNNCGGVGFKQAFTTPMPTCPVGYTLSPDMSYCYKTTTVPADYIGGGSPYTICRNAYSQYNSFPMRVMKWVSGAPGYSTNGVPLTGGAYAPASVSSGTWWFNAANDPAVGPLNRSGIWPCNGGAPCVSNCPPQNVDVGFTSQFNVPSDGIYYIGMGADNKAKIEVQDGVGGLRTLVEEDPAAIGTYFSSGSDVVFKSWLVYPVQLFAGPTLITVTGVNDSTMTPGVIGFEIYNNTEAQILAASAYGGLNYIFSTDPTLGFVTLGDNFSSGNYSCSSHPGYSLVYDSGTNTYSCVLIETVPPTT